MYFNKKEKIGDKIKQYEKKSQNIVCLDPCEGFAIRLIGRGFEKYRSKLFKLKRAMTIAAMCTVKKFHAILAYTSFNEIILLFRPRVIDKKTKHIFDGQVIKILISVSSFVTICFNQEIKLYSDHNIINSGKFGLFDTRIILCPDHEYLNLLIWRSNRFSRFIGTFKNKFISLCPQDNENGISNDILTKKIDYALDYGVFIKKSRSRHINSTLIENNKNISFNLFIFKNIKYSEKMLEFIFSKDYNDIIETQDFQECQPIFYKNQDLSQSCLEYYQPIKKLYKQKYFFENIGVLGWRYMIFICMIYLILYGTFNIFFHQTILSN
jgi:hypothetical protein